MPKKTSSKKPARQPLSRDRVLRAALALADRSGTPSLSMRKLARRLGVEAMSLYKHVTNKDEVLDGLADLVVSQIVLPAPGAPWRAAMRERALSARQVFMRHRWAAALLEARGNTTSARLRYADTILGILRKDGFSVPKAYRAFLLLDSYIYGFIAQQLNWPDEQDEQPQELENLKAVVSIPEYPHLTDAMTHFMRARTASGAGRIYDVEFEYGLEVILDSLERLRGG
jgi:AcrR family transcriptional regulator